MNGHYHFEEVAHTADIAIRVRGRDLAELFANAAYGMACQLANPSKVDQTILHQVELDAYDTETLLVSWLGELLYLGEWEECVFVNFEMLQVAPTQLRAIVRGGAVKEYKAHIKAVTFNELKIVDTDEGYETTVVFDV